MARRGSDGAALLSLAAGYAGPLFTARASFGPAGRRRSLEACRAVVATLPEVRCDCRLE